MILPVAGRGIVATCVGGAAGIFAVPGVVALTGSTVAALLAGAALAALLGVLAWRGALVPLDDAAASRALTAVAAVATLIALVQLGRLAVFTVDAARVGFSSIPSSAWEVQHSCLTAYHVAGEAAGSGANVYETSLYNMPDDDPAKPRKARTLGPFRVDVYEYPPPFLLLPRALQKVTPDFSRLRMLWFTLHGAVVLLAFVLVARWLGPSAGTRALLLSPLVWMAVPTLSTLQKGNVQAMVIAGSVIAMALLARRRWAAGGALLAFATASKLYPGLLVVFLLARRQWRAVAWTAAMGLLFLAASVADLGLPAYGAFLEHLPGLMSGEAFPAFRNPAPTAINLSIPGLVFKLRLFGVPGMDFDVARIVGWVYTHLAVALTIIAALGRRRDRAAEPLLWLAVLIVATLRSPFLPQAYGSMPPLWLLTLLAATMPLRGRSLALVLGAWAALNVYWPTDWPLDPRVLALVNAVPQAATIGVAVAGLRRAHGRVEERT